MSCLLLPTIFLCWYWHFGVDQLSGIGLSPVGALYGDLPESRYRDACHQVIGKAQREPDEDLRLQFEAVSRLDGEEKKVVRSELEGL